MSPGNEETRKVQRLGSSTLALSLPAEWVDDQGIEKGDALTIRRSDRALSVMSPTTADRNVEAVIDADALDAETVERLVTAQYVLGRRVITVESSGELDRDVVDAVYDVEGRLMGLGVIEETMDRVSIRCSIDPEDFDVDALVERLEHTARSMRGDAITALAYGNPELAQRAIDRDRQAEKVFVLLLRLLSTADGNPAAGVAIGVADNRSLVGYRSIVGNLELLADDAGELARLVLEADRSHEVDESTVSEIRRLADRVDELSADAIEAFVDRDYERTLKVRSSFRRVADHRSAILSGLSALSDEDRRFVHDLLVRLHTSAQYALRNAEVAADVALNDDSEFVTIR